MAESSCVKSVALVVVEMANLESVQFRTCPCRRDAMVQDDTEPQVGAIGVTRCSLAGIFRIDFDDPDGF